MEKIINKNDFVAWIYFSRYLQPPGVTQQGRGGCRAAGFVFGSTALSDPTASLPWV